MTKQHPITPPPELVEQWLSEHYGTPTEERKRLIGGLATEAARWGADQELEAMLAELKALHLPDGYAAKLHAARRPKPPSLKEQALALLDKAEALLDKAEDPSWDINDFSIIRQALEALSND